MDPPIKDVAIVPASAPIVANPLEQTPVAFREALERRSATRLLLLGWIRESLVSGVDFGPIHFKKDCDKGRHCTNQYHFSKPSLFKPGAEKICGMLGVKAVFPSLPDYEKAALEGRRLEYVIIRCHLLSEHGEIVADGVGGRTLSKDGGDINKALKMALKSAHIDATLRMAGLSEVFTQDIEDMTDGGTEMHSGVPAPSERRPDPPPAGPVAQLVPSGKYKDQPWEKVPDDYLHWLVHGPFQKGAPRPDMVEGGKKEIARRAAVFKDNEPPADIEELDDKIPF